MIMQPQDGWTFHVATAGARVVYVNASSLADCSLTATSTAGYTTIWNVQPGIQWIVAKKGTTVLPLLVGCHETVTVK